MSNKLPDGMEDRDINVTMAIESALRDAVASSLTTLSTAGVQFDERHIMSAIMSFFVSSLATMVKPEAWDNLLESLSTPEMRASMLEHANDLDNRLKAIRQLAESAGEPSALAVEKNPGTMN